ncbi:hypothetical protein I4U23_021520 [Adineta vaga]|nr:hypothetical protein I4U23_021520 [Adineta vaga]
MTGSFLFDRQHSLAAGYSNINKVERSKLRRWSSAESPYLSDDQQKVEEIQSFQRNQTPSDFDSGLEDSDQQNGNDINDDEPIGDFEADTDECIEENLLTPIATEKHTVDNNYSRKYLVELASSVPNIDKKEFCDNTMVVFHAECALQVSRIVNSINPNYQYYLWSEEEVNSDACQWPGCGFLKLDNAKAQFRCTNPSCQRLWTSMRARILFKVSYPQPNGYIVLKILGQNCRNCHAFADALWYMDEVCRVMKNLFDSILAIYFPWMVDFDLENTIENQSFQRPRHDPKQRKGAMRAQHNRNLCEACRVGACFA